MAEFKIKQLWKELDMLVKAMTTQNISPTHQAAQISECAICSHFDHTTKTCRIYSFLDQGQANYVGQNNYPPKNNSYSNTYNAGWQIYAGHLKKFHCCELSANLSNALYAKSLIKLKNAPQFIDSIMLWLG